MIPGFLGLFRPRKNTTPDPPSIVSPGSMSRSLALTGPYSSRSPEP
jgi:hypothetical protein